MNEYGLTPKQQEIVRQAALGKSQRDIAKCIPCHHNSVWRTLNSPQGKRMLAEIQGAVQSEVVTSLAERFDLTAEEAYKTLVSLMRGSNPQVAFRACESLLDRASSAVAPKRVLHSKSEVQGQVINLHIGRAELERMQQVLVEAAGGDLESVPELPEMNQHGEYVVEIDGESGEILGEGV